MDPIFGKGYEREPESRVKSWWKTVTQQQQEQEQEAGEKPGVCFLVIL